MGQKRSHRSDLEPAKWDWRAISDVERANWEWRAFWSDAAAAPSLDEVLGHPGRGKLNRFVDRYLVVETCQDNIKVRKGNLQAKQLIKQYDQFEAYRPKQKFTFPLSKRELSGIFPSLSGPDGALPAPRKSSRRSPSSGTSRGATTC
jgi:hypothetical protein